MKRTFSLIIVCFLFISCTGVEQESAVRYTEPASLGFDVELLSEIDSLLYRQMDEEKIAGAVALIAKEGQIAYKKAFGWKDVEAEASMNTNQLFRIASMTKIITSVAIMQLYEKGQVSPLQLSTISYSCKLY
jgi:CubicO group peptidase (beta-lactamase class C family)